MRVKELDGLRGIAIIAVICVHYFSWLRLPTMPHGIFVKMLLMPISFILLLPTAGGLGVNLFFVLSGFLITTILLDLRKKEHYFRIFYSRRAFRILPPYLLCMIIYMASSFALGKPGSWSLWMRYLFYYSSLLPHLPRELTAVPPLLPLAVCGGLGVLWSLSVEELYYTFWAPIVRYVPEKGFIVLIAAMIFAAPLLRYLLYASLHSDAGYIFYCQMDGLAYGSAVALLFQTYRVIPIAFMRINRFLDRLCVVTAASAVLLIVLSNFGLISPRLFFTFIFALANPTFALVLYVVLRKAGSEQRGIRWLRAYWLRSTGKVSYSLYLFHVSSLLFAQSLLSRIHGERHVMVLLGHALGLSFSLGAAYSSWYLLESPLLRWKDRLVPNRVPKFSEAALARSSANTES